MSAAGTAHPGFPPQSPIAELSALLALIIVANLPWSYGMIGDAGGRLALVLVDFAALAGGLGFPLLGRLHWAWLNSWWPTKHIHACSVIANQVIFSRKSGRRSRCSR